jgi:diphosphomevalonate decarboxylase
MPNRDSTAVAFSNIAFIKYWGNRDESLRLPANGSISMNLAGLETQTSVTFDTSLQEDFLTINGQQVHGSGLQRVSTFLDDVRRMAESVSYARVESQNNFPAGVGIASSAAAFAALALASSQAAGLTLNETQLSRLARLGSGSACRSIPGGFVEWQTGSGDDDSYGVSIAPPDHWTLSDCILLISSAQKETSSTEGHRLAATSPLQSSRLADAPRRLEICRNAILQRDFEALAEVVELDSNWMHAVMMTSKPPLIYWQEATLTAMREVSAARKAGLPVCYTVDAGPNVHVICERANEEKTVALLANLPGVQEVRVAHVGGPARII